MTDNQPYEPPIFVFAKKGDWTDGDLAGMLRESAGEEDADALNSDPLKDHIVGVMRTNPRFEDRAPYDGDAPETRAPDQPMNYTIFLDDD